MKNLRGGRRSQVRIFYQICHSFSVQILPDVITNFTKSGHFSPLKVYNITPVGKPRQRLALPSTVDLREDDVRFPYKSYQIWTLFNLVTLPSLLKIELIHISMAEEPAETSIMDISVSYPDSSQVLNTKLSYPGSSHFNFVSGRIRRPRSPGQGEGRGHLASSQASTRSKCDQLQILPD